jgi:hypothetical protein
MRYRGAGGQGVEQLAKIQLQWPQRVKIHDTHVFWGHRDAPSCSLYTQVLAYNPHCLCSIHTLTKDETHRLRN